MIKAVLWDIDGTLLNFLKSEKYGIKKCFELFGLGECTDEMIERYSKINQKYWKRLELGEITKPQVLRGRFEEFFTLENLGFDRIDDFNSEYQVRLGDKVFFFDNGPETVEALRGRVKQYAVTNGTYIAQKRKLELSGLDKIFNGIFISDKIGFEKPSVEFFDYVRKNIPPYDNSEIMIVGDSLTGDMRGGNNAGYLCCWYNPDGKTNNTDIKIDYEITDLQQVIDIIDKLA
ncbi:MAG: YjjG family noncanonical pyrimidine nucleotidase [Oscillospiraceae bacterium]|nr:YjjG family noncanonical pyrimidine nucleotidase [Oscillospiraceae bacterium]